MLYCADIQHAKIAFFFNMLIFFLKKCCRNSFCPAPAGVFALRPEDELGDVFDVLCVREHVDGLDASHLVFPGKEADVAGLCGGVAADVYDASGLHGEELFHDFLVHAGTRRVGDDDIGTAVRGDKVGGEHFGHVAGEELGVVYPVGDGVLACCGDGVLDVFYADDLPAHVGEEKGDGAGAGVKVIDGVGGCELCILRHEGVEPLCLA